MRLFRFASSSALLLLLVACGPTDGTGTPGRLTLPPAEPRPTTPAKTPVGTAVATAFSVTVGADGGTLVTPDEGLTVIIPAGAAPAGTVISATPITNHVPGGFGPAYRLTKPDSVQFAQPVTVRFAFSEPDLEGRSAKRLRIVRQRPDTTWEAFATTVDLTNKTLSVTTTSFSDWAAMSDLRLLPASSQVRKGHSKNLVIKTCELRMYDDGMGGTLTALTVYDCTMSNGLGIPASWAVNGTAGGTSTLGKISNAETYGATFTAPDEVPQPETVEVSVELEAAGNGRDLLIARVKITETLGYQGTLRVAAYAGGGGSLGTTALQAHAKLLFLRTYDDASSANYELEVADATIDILKWGYESPTESCKQRGNATISPPMDGLTGSMGITKNPATYSFGGMVSLNVPARCRSKSSGTESTRDFDGLAFIYGTDTPGSFQEQPLPDPASFDTTGFLLHIGTIRTTQDWSFSRTFQ